MEAKIKPLGEDAPKKKRHIMRWIFNILCLLAISFLFLVGVWTRTLLFVWLIVPIVLWIAAFKRKFAGWLALGFLACIAGIIIWLFLPDTGNWRPYNFDYELKDLEAKRAVPDTENAAIAYQKIIARLDVNNAPPFYDEDCNGNSIHVLWKGSDHPETAAFLDARADLIAEVIAAAKMEKCAFPLWTNPLNMPLDMFNRMRHISYLVASAANRDMGEEKREEALEKYKCLISIGRKLQYQTTVIQLLMGISIEALADRQLQSGIIGGDLNKAQLDYIRQMLPTTTDDWPELYSSIFQCDKVMCKNMFGLMTYEINDAGFVRFRRDPVPFPKELRQSLPPTTALQRKLQKFSSVAMWFVSPQNPRHLGQIFDEEFERSRKLYDVNQLEIKPSTDTGFHLKWLADPYRYTARMMAQMSLPAHVRVHQKYLQTIVYRRTMYILLALREYKEANGRWPNNLDQIKDKVPAEAMIDPFTGGSFIYEAKGEKFLLYSVGENKIDEKGKPGPNCRDRSRGTEKSLSDDILIWPQKFEQAKEFF